MQNRETHHRISMNIGFLLVLFLAIMLGSSGAVHADSTSEGYELLEYNQSTVVNKSHDYDVTLKLTINAPENLNTVNVQLPNGKFVLTDVEVAGHDSRVITDENGNESVRIEPKGRAFKKGEQTLTVKYSILEYAEKNHANDMFYYDALSPNWSVPIGNLKLALEFPDDFDWSDLQYFAGQYGSQDVNNMVSYQVRNNTVTMTGQHIPANFGITFKAQLPDGYWKGALDNSWALQFSLILMIVVLALIFLFWLIGGRDPRLKKTREAYPIEGVTPADIGFLFYGRTRIRDVAVMIVQLAIRGYLRIVEYQPKKYRLVRLKEPKEEERFIRTAYNALFEDVYEGRALDVDRMGVRMRSVMKIVSDSVESGYSTKDMRACTAVSRVLRVISILILAIGFSAVYMLADTYAYQTSSVFTLVVVAAVTAVSLILINHRFDNRYEISRQAYRIGMFWYVLLYSAAVGFVSYHMWSNTDNLMASIGIFAAAAVAMVLTLFMKSRAKGNAALVGRILSLRRFMNRVKTDDLAKDSLADEDYYYEMLPFALQFSLEEIWARKFRWLGTKRVDFFESKQVGNTMERGDGYKNTELIARDLKTFCRTVESEYHNVYGKRRLF